MRHIFVAAVVLVLAAPSIARAHCDALDGPVVVSAGKALESGKLEPVLAWVRPADEAQIRDAFARARTVRKGGKEARELADRWFFETVVRVHRAGEGAPFTGLAPAGGIEPTVAAVDRAVATGDLKPVEALLVNAVRTELHAREARLRREAPPAHDVAAGRRWVAAYVPLVHWVEGVHRAATSGGEHGEGEAHGQGEAHGKGGEHAAQAHEQGHAKTEAPGGHAH
jgi:hypothetical protein